MKWANPFKMPLFNAQPVNQTDLHKDQWVPPNEEGDEFETTYPTDVEHWGTETSTEFWPEGVPGYAGEYDLRYLPGTPGQGAAYGSNVFRDTDAVQAGSPGHNYGSVTVGPVRGSDSERWTWQSIRPGAVYPGYYGPVTGFGVSGDASQLATRAYFQQEAAQYAQAAAESAMLAVS